MSQFRPNSPASPSHADLASLLERQRGYLSRLIDAIPHLIYVKDASGRYLLVNQATAAFFGLKPYELLGKSDQEVCRFAANLPLLVEGDREVLSELRTMVFPEQRLQHANLTTPRWYHTIKQAVRSEDDTGHCLLGISTDLTERKLAEDALRLIVEGTASSTAEDFFHQLVRYLASALETKYAFVGRIDPLDPESIETLAIWKGNHFAENERYAVQGSPSEQIIKSGLLYCEQDLQSRFPQDTGLKRHGINSYLGAPIYDAHANVLGVLAVMDNKTIRDWQVGRWIMHIFAARAGAELERLLTEGESRRLQRQLLHAQKMEAIGQLAAGVAHDLNNALGAVVGHLQLIRMEDAIAPDVMSSINTALGGCERASSLIQQLLAFSRQEKYNLEDVSLYHIVSETIKFLGRIIGKDIQIKIEHIPEDLIICGDQGQLQQALTNLIINAMHAMPQGGTITFSSKSIHIHAPQHFNPKSLPGDYALLRVSDTGVGIKSEHLSKIFEPFFSTREFSCGTGLGLAMVYSIMQNHGGWIEVHSQPDKGTTFVLYLPISNHDQTVVSKGGVASVKANGGKIMIVDDEPVLVDLAVRFMQKSGLAAEGFTAGEDAIAWYRENYSSVDMVVLDVKMPGLSGEECFDQIRQINPHAQVVILSGYVHDDSAEALVKKGALKFFHKPLQYPELVQWIAAHLEKEGS